MEKVKTLLRPAFGTPAGRVAHRKLTAAAVMAQAMRRFDRPAWLYRFGAAIPAQELHFRPARPVTDADVALCQRLIDAYVLAEADAPGPPSGMWTHELFQARQRELMLALRDRDPVVLAERLASMFRSDFVIGMAAGSLGVAVARA